MKKSIILASFLLTIAAAQAVTNVATALESPNLNADVFRPVINKAVYDTVNTDVPALVTAANANAATAAASGYGQSDTNATTTVTNYLPRGKGDILVGKEGGSNRAWIATSAATGGWTIKVIE